MPIDFPNSPTTNEQYIYNGTVWQWNGSAWIVVGTNAGIGNYITTFNGLTGAVTGISNLNGYTGSTGGGAGAPQWPVGQTSGSVTVITFPSGVTSFGSKIPYYQPYQLTYPKANPTGLVSTNRVYFSLFNTARQISLHTLRITGANTGITGTCYFGIYNADPITGMPKTRLYSSGQVTVGSLYNYTSVSNASGLITIDPGYFYIAVVFDNTPTLYSLSPAYLLSTFGSGNLSSGYQNMSPFADPGGFTLPASLPSTGITFGFIDYVPAGPVPGILSEYRIV